LTTAPKTVLIDGVRYVPVSEANPSAAALEDAIVGQWAGSSWRDSYPDAPGYLRVIVDDMAGDDEGETVTDFLARLLQALGAPLEASSDD
jgi:hypothetical protein